jgi:hypothetical protein
MQPQAIAALKQTPGFLRDLLAAAAKEQMDWRPAPDRWSITMVLAHLADVEVKGFGQRFWAIAEQDSPFLPAYEQLALFAAGAEFDGAEQLEIFAERRKQSLVWLHSLPASVMERTGRHEELGTVTFGQLLNEFALHDLGHIRQVAELYRACAFYPNIGPFERYYKMNP